MPQKSKRVRASARRTTADVAPTLDTAPIRFPAEGRFSGACMMPTDFMSPVIKRGSPINVDTRYYSNHEPGRWEVIVFWGLAMEQASFRIGLGAGAQRAAGTLTATPTIDTLAREAGRLTERQGIAVRPHLLYCKRIVGLPGERIQITSSSILINGRRVASPKVLATSYRNFGDVKQFRFAGAEPLDIPGDSVFVLSDNLKGQDSRIYGVVPMITVLGRVNLPESELA
jgi:signal peptidase I